MSATKNTTRTVLLSSLVEEPGFNPRSDYGEADGSFAELVESIRTRGVLQPPLVRESRGKERYTIVIGHRRVRAAREAGFVEITVCVLPWVEAVDDFPLALIENLHRKDLNPIERAKGYQRLVDTGLSTHEISRLIGIAQTSVWDSLQLLGLPQSVQKSVSERTLGVTAAQSIARGVKQGLSQTRATSIAKQARTENLTAYDTRALVAQAVGREEPQEPRTPSELILAVPYSKKPIVEWALRRFGSLDRALEALHELSVGTTQPKAEEESAVVGTARDPLAVVRAAQSRRWPEILVGYSASTGALRATPTGPLPVGFALICTLLPSGRVHIPMTASGAGRTLGERIKDNIEGPRRAGIK